MLTEFIQNLLENGEVAFRFAPETAPADRTNALEVLKSAFDSYGLGIAGPPVAFDAATAVAAAEFVHWSCWFLVHRDSPAEEVERKLSPVASPKTVSQHLSADLTFRYLAQLYRRASALAVDDVLTQRLKGALRAFPLSGVLAQLDEAPLCEPDFGGHEGLELLARQRRSAKNVHLPKEADIRNAIRAGAERASAGVNERVRQNEREASGAAPIVHDAGEHDRLSEHVGANAGDEIRAILGRERTGVAGVVVEKPAVDRRVEVVARRAGMGGRGRP